MVNIGKILRANPSWHRSFSEVLRIFLIFYIYYIHILVLFSMTQIYSFMYDTVCNCRLPHTLAKYQIFHDNLACFAVLFKFFSHRFSYQQTTILSFKISLKQCFQHFLWKSMCSFYCAALLFSTRVPAWLRIAGLATERIISPYPNVLYTESGHVL